MNPLIEELTWRGLVHNIMPGTEEQLNKEMTSGYVGFDPTADSLHVGSLVPIFLLVHLERHGHRPISLVGGATGFIGDPTGKAAERSLLDEETLNKYVAGIKAQLSRFLDFDTNNGNSALLVNNYDWMKNFSFIDFARNVGKHITVNYMMAKDSVKSRLSSESNVGMSFTEFTYQLIQGYDYLHLYKELGVKLQMGGSDQWGNITTGTELIRRTVQGEAFAFTCPLTTNQADADAERYIKIYTFLEKEAIDDLIERHRQEPHLRELQRKLATEITILVHGVEELRKAEKASQVLFGKSTSEDLKELDGETFLSVFEGVPQATVAMTDIEEGLDIVAALADKTGFLKSNSEARRELKANAISVNKEKVADDFVLTTENLIADKYVLLQKGKKNYFILIVE